MKKSHKQLKKASKRGSYSKKIHAGHVKLNHDDYSVREITPDDC